jgi:hypothetical protein
VARVAEVDLCPSTSGRYLVEAGQAERSAASAAAVIRSTSGRAFRLPDEARANCEDEVGIRTEARSRGRTLMLWMTCEPIAMSIPLGCASAMRDPKPVESRRLCKQKPDSSGGAVAPETWKISCPTVPEQENFPVYCSRSSLTGSATHCVHDRVRPLRRRRAAEEARPAVFGAELPLCLAPPLDLGG